MANPLLHPRSAGFRSVLPLLAVGLVAVAIWSYYRAFRSANHRDAVNRSSVDDGFSTASVRLPRAAHQILPTIPATEAAEQRRQASEAGLDPASVGWSSEALKVPPSLMREARLT